MKQRTEKPLIERVVEAVLAFFTLHPREFFAQIVLVHVEETFLLDEITEHQSVEHDACIPLLVLVLLYIDIIVQTRNVIDKTGMLLAETRVEVLCNPFGVDNKRTLHPLLHIHDGGVVVQVERQTVHLFVKETGGFCILVFHQHQVSLLKLIDGCHP